MTEYDNINHPKHYCRYEHEVIELTSRLGFCLGNAAKYILRAPYKNNELEDLQKARWYLQHYLDHHKPLDEPLFDDETVKLALSFNVPMITQLFAKEATVYDGVARTIEMIDEKLEREEIEALKDELAWARARNEELKEELAKARMARPLPGVIHIRELAPNNPACPMRDIFGNPVWY